MISSVLAFTYAKLFHLVTYGQLFYLLMWKLFQNFFGRSGSPKSKVFRIQRCENLFSNLVTIDLLSELYLMGPLLLLVTNSNRLIRYWITATGAGARTSGGPMIRVRRER